MRRFHVLLVLTVVAVTARAQKFTHMSTLPRVERDGFYEIRLTPEMGGYLTRDYSNVRIFDQSTNKEVQFLIDREIPVDRMQVFHPYEIVESKLEQGCCTTLIFRNKNKKPIDNINLEIKNADVTKKATLLGSDDRKQWYALKEQFYLYTLGGNSKTTHIEIVNFPLSNYAYYSLRINDSTSAPLNILHVGSFEVHTNQGFYAEVPGLQLNTADSIDTNQTYVHFSFDGNRFVDRIDLTISGTPFYLRSAALYELHERIDKKGRHFIEKEFIQSAELSSTHTPTLSFASDMQFKDLLMIIENDDNPSLSITSAKAFQLNRYFIAWLKKDDSYALKFAKDLPVPSYDLVFFADSIPEFPPVIEASAVVSLQTEKSVETETVIFTSSRIVWLAIILVIIVLGFMSVKMVRETSAKKE